MNIRRTDARKVGEDIANAGASPEGNRNDLLVQLAANDQVLVNPLAIIDVEVRTYLSKWTKTSPPKLKPSRLKLTEKLFLVRSNMLVLQVVV